MVYVFYVLLVLSVWNLRQCKAEESFINFQAENNTINGTVVVYVSTMGNDTSGTGEAHFPFASLQRALEELKYNTNESTIYLFPGIYTNQTLITDQSINQTLPVLYIKPAPENIINETDIYLNNNDIENNTVIYMINELTFEISQLELSFANISLSQVYGKVNGDKYIVKTDNCTINGINITVDGVGLIDFENSNFDGGYIKILGINVVINNCRLKNLNYQVQFITNNITISHSEYRDNLAPLQISSYLSFINYCTFVNNIGARAGSLLVSAIPPPIIEPQILVINASLFVNNTAYGNYFSIGPACVIEVDALIINTIFSCNKYNTTTSIPPIADGIKHILFENCNYNPACEPQCPKGQYSIFHMIQCKPCQPGSFSNTTTADQCTLCQPGESTNGFLGLDGCIACIPGNYATYPGTSRCSPCHPGTASIDRGTITCPKCSAGTYQSDSGQTSCLDCETGSVSFEGSSGCKLCGQGTYASISDCLDCDMWYTSNPGAMGCTSPSWRMSALIAGMVGFAVIVFGVFVIGKEKRRLGYFAVHSKSFQRDSAKLINQQ